MTFNWLMIQLRPFQSNPNRRKLNIVPFALMMNDKPVIACYLLQHSISSSFHIFSLFSSLKSPSNITPKQT